ncbi:MAG: hypothetical protein SWJ54_18415 [Cyanobacteriota bacterium]|nr:hypothetical protein [Cyanobacteriota bacterium]
MTSSNNIDQRLNAIEADIIRLREGQQTLSLQLENLARVSLDLVEVSKVIQQEAQRDREAWRVENRQIWEYLLRQRPNGNQPTSED